MIRVGHRRQKDDTLFLYFTVTKWFQEIDDILQFLHFGLQSDLTDRFGNDLSIFEDGYIRTGTNQRPTLSLFDLFSCLCSKVTL